MGKKLLYMVLLITFLTCSSIGNVQGESIKNANEMTTLEASKENKEGKGIEGTVKEGALPLKNTPIFIKEKGNNSKSYYTMTDSKGTFKTEMPDGAYSIKALKNQQNTWYSTNATFSIQDGKINSSRDHVITISTKKKMKEPLHKSNTNLNGVLKEGDQGIKGDLIISRYTSEYDEESFTVSSKNNGQFSASLPDGDYFLFGIDIDGGYYRYEMFFSVENNEVLINGEIQSEISINLPLNAYKGKVVDSIKALTEAGIVLEKIIDEENYDYEFIQHVLTNKKGEFSLRELTDGAYTISIYHETLHSWQLLKFEVVNGSIFIDGQKASILEINIPDLTLKGTLLDGKKPISNAYVNIEGYTEEGDHIGFFSTSVDNKGTFQYRLSDGNYTITSVDEQTRSTTVNDSFEIRGGKLIQDGVVKTSLTLSLPPITFSGKLLDERNVLQGSLNVEKLSEDGNYEWYYTSTDENGIFSLRLTDGQYRIISGYLYDENEDIALSTVIEIREGKLYVGGQQQALLELQIPPISLQGIIFDGEKPLSSGEIMITTSNEEYYYWKWINADGTFSMRLADGTYKMKSIFMEDGTSAYIDQTFTIKDGKLYVNDELLESLEITVPPVTLSGTLFEEGNPVMGEIHIMTINEANYPLDFSGWANDEGEFQFRLPDGNYIVNSVYLYDGSTFSPSTEFSIESGTLYVNGEKENSLNLIVEPVTLSGHVYNGDKLVDEGYVNVMSANDDMHWYSSWIEEDGLYKFRLPDGEYQLVSVDHYPNESVNLYKDFTIQSGKIIVEGQELDFWDINLQ